MRKPFLIIIDGPMGAGKSTVAKILHLKLDRTALLSWDDLKWMVNGLQNTVEDKNMIAEIRLEAVGKMLSCGVNVIVEGGFSKQERLQAILDLANELKVKYFGYYLTAPEEVLLERALARPKPATEKEKISKENILENIKNHPQAADGFNVIETDSLNQHLICKKIIVDITK